MIVIKGWRDRKDMYVISKACEHFDFSTAMEMLESVKSGPDEGRIRLPGGTMFQYNRYTNGRIIVKQI